MLKKTFIFLLTLFFSSSAYASDIKLLVSLGQSFGGDKVPGMSLNLGDGIIYSVGLMSPVLGTLGIKGSINYQANNSTSGSTPQEEFSSTSVDLLVTKVIKRNHLLGVGITYHPSLNATCDTCAPLKFENTMGYTAEYLYMFKGYKAEGYALSAKYTQITFENSGVSLDGSKYSFSGIIYY